MPDPLPRLRKLCLALADAHEVPAWGEPTFRVNNKIFAMFSGSGNHHGAERPAVWVKAMPANQALMMDAQPARYFAPPYVGPKGWIGAWLDEQPDWATIADLVADAHAMTAPKAKAKPKAHPTATTKTPAKPKATATAKHTTKAKTPTTAKQTTKPKPKPKKKGPGRSSS